MARKGKLTDKQRMKAAEEYLKGEGSYEGIAKKYGIGYTTIRNLVRRAKSEGLAALRVSSKNKRYSKATKRSAVEDYLSGKGSLELARLSAARRVPRNSVITKFIF